MVPATWQHVQYHKSQYGRRAAWQHRLVVRGDEEEKDMRGGGGGGGGGGASRPRRGPHRRGRARTRQGRGQDRQERLRLVAGILRKKEAARSGEEVALLGRLHEEARVVARRLGAQQRRRERGREVEDEEHELRAKCRQLGDAVRAARHLVVYTGAGISTAADIPDYRGPNGIWTLLQQGKQIGKHDLTKSDPTLTHMALYELYRKRYLKFVVSQNCDGLHLRSGLPRAALSEVHGDMYVEVCGECQPPAQYWRLFDTTERTARYCHNTGRLCHRCAAPLRDSIVHFGEKGVAKWPLNWPGALHHAAKADVILCLGSSLKVLKRYPWLWAMDRPVKKRPNIFIVNLQWTPKDCVAALKINGKCDTVMKMVMEHLQMGIPAYRRRDDPIFAHATPLSPEERHTTAQPTLVSEVVGEETDDDSDEDEDEDCPLNVLKEKMYTNSYIESDDTVLDLSIAKKRSHTRCDLLMEQRRRKVVRCLNRSRRLVSDGENQHLRLNMSASEFSCTVQADKCESHHKSNLKINLNSSSQPSATHPQGISMEILAEEFERVHVEMKTNDNEIHQVSILLVNKTKISPTKCNKFQQTDSDNEFDQKPLIQCKIKQEHSKDFDNYKTSLRDFRMCKNNQYSNVDNKKFHPVSDEPLNLSGREVARGSVTETLNPVRHPCILRVPKPILSLRLAHIEKQNQVGALDLRTSESGSLTKINEGRVERIKPLFSIPLDLQKDVFKKKFQALTRVIMDNAISASRDELQYAYSGIHSIIHPIPFFVQYDFKSVFRSINFIRLGQKLLSNGNGKTVACDKAVPKRLKKSKERKKPSCQFCYDHYDSYACNFYSAHREENRLRKYKNGKPVVCECCISSDSSDSDSEPAKRKSKDEEEEDLDDDLSKSVQISGNNVKVSGDKEVCVQAGWFGKGFRKSRRRKR